jgi:hypothetical protein
MTRMMCPQCDGRQIVRRSGVVLDCPGCWGRGWVTRPVATYRYWLAILRDAIVGLLVTSAILIVASGVPT